MPPLTSTTHLQLARHVRLTDEDNGNVIDFYNGIYTLKMRDFLMQLFETGAPQSAALAAFPAQREHIPHVRVGPVCWPAEPLTFAKLTLPP